MTLRTAIAGSLLALALLPAAAAAEPDHSGTVSPAAATFEWDGALATGHNTARDPKACSKDVETYCDVALVKVDIPADSTAEVKFDIGEYFGPQCTPADGQNAPCDFSLWIYASDAAGTVGKHLGNSVNDSGEPEEVKRRVGPGYYLAVVFYYTVAQSSYKGKATLSAVEKVVPEVPAEAPATPAGPPAPPAFPTAGDLKVAITSAGKATAKGIPVRVTCSIVCRGPLVAELSAAQARKLGLGRKKLVIGKATVSVDKAEGALVTLKLTGKAARKLAKAKSVKLAVRVTVRDASAAFGATAALAVALKR